MLALELLENDIEVADKFVNNIIKYLENIRGNSFEGTYFYREDSELFKILSFYNYEVAKKAFKDNPILFHKTIYDLKLFSPRKTD